MLKKLLVLVLGLKQYIVVSFHNISDVAKHVANVENETMV